MNIAELIVAVGIENTAIQVIDQCADTLDWNAKNGVTRIKFGVEQPITPNGMEKFGIVVWMPRDKVDAALAKAKEGEGA